MNILDINVLEINILNVNIRLNQKETNTENSIEDHFGGLFCRLFNLIKHALCVVFYVKIQSMMEVHQRRTL